jgi:lyso-ornithine lipid O-acyltransferase
MGSPLRSATRLGAYFLLTLALLPAQAVAIGLRLRLAEAIPLFYHRLCCRILGFRVLIIGEMSAARPTLFVCNHSSYIDITVLASCIPAGFIAKAEVARWPFFGLLARLQRCVFIERRPSRAAHHRDTIAARLAGGDNLILFPEGTSDDGNRVLPFKSALFSVAGADLEAAALTVQPVSIAYTRLDGMPIGRMLRPYFAWYGDMGLLPHLWAMAGLGETTIELRFHAPVDLARFASRKALADHCYETVSSGLATSISGKTGSGKTCSGKTGRAAPPLPVTGAQA